MKMICIALLFVVTTSALGISSLDQESVNAGSYNGVFNRLSEENFDSLDATSKYVFIAAAHLSENNQVGYELRKKLTDADYDEMNKYLPAPDGMYLETGELLLYAQIREISGDYGLAQDYCERAFDALDNAAANTDNMKDFEISRWATINSRLLGMYATVSFLAQKEDAKKASAYTQVGEMMRLLGEIEKSTEAMGLDLDSILADTSNSIPDTTQVTAVETTDEPIVEESFYIDEEQATIMNNLYERGSEEFTDRLAFLQFHRGEFLTNQGRTAEALKQYEYATQSDCTCNLFWKKWLEVETNQKNIEVTGGMWKLYAKETKIDTIPVLHMCDCLIATGEASKAIKEDTKFLKKNPNCTYALAQRARAYYETKDNVKAAADAMSAVAIDSTNYEGWYILGLTSELVSDPKAKEYFEKALLYSPEELRVHREIATKLK